MSESRSIPRASIPASRKRPRNSPRPQPRSSTGRGFAEVLDVRPLPLADALCRPAHAALEGEVVGEDDLAGGGRRRRGCCRSGGLAQTTLEAGEPLVELNHELDPGAKLLRDLEAPLQRRVLLVSTRRDRVQELQRGGVEPALICRERLDIPAHQLAQDALERCERQSAQPPERAGSFEKRPLRADRPELLGFAAAALESVHPVFGAEVAVAAVHLLTQPRQDRLELRLLGSQAVFRHVAIVGTGWCHLRSVGPGFPFSKPILENREPLRQDGVLLGELRDHRRVVQQHHHDEERGEHEQRGGRISDPDQICQPSSSRLRQMARTKMTSPVSSQSSA